MTKRELIVIIGIISLIIMTLVIFSINKNKIKKKNEELSISQNIEWLEYDENEGKYLVYDEAGKEIYNGTNRAEAEFRERHPDFNPRIWKFESKYSSNRNYKKLKLEGLSIIFT